MEKKADQTLLNISLLGNPEVSFGDGTLLKLPKKILALLSVSGHRANSSTAFQINTTVLE